MLLNSKNNEFAAVEQYSILFQSQVQYFGLLDWIVILKATMLVAKFIQWYPGDQSNDILRNKYLQIVQVAYHDF